jgi:hypothetical protein
MGLLLLVTSWKSKYAFLSASPMAAGRPPPPEQLDYELVFDVAIAMRLRRALRGKMPEGNYESHSQPAFIAVSTLRVFQDIVTKCLKTGSFAVIAMSPATHGADFGGPKEASFPLDKVRSTCCSF